jgi:methionyl-tRNA synthetase
MKYLHLLIIVTVYSNKKPWETQDKKVLYELADNIKAVTILLWPFIPET